MKRSPCSTEVGLFPLALKTARNYIFTSMQSPQHDFNRRSFLKAATTAAAALSLSNGSSLIAGVVGDRKIKLGLDNFAVRALKWKADALIDYAVQLKTDSLFITDLFAFENFEDSYLVALRKKAADKGLDIQLGSWSRHTGED